MATICEEKAKFIKEALIASGFSAFEIVGMRGATIYRKDKGSRFVMVWVVSDHRDPDWSLRLSVGDGFPEESEDPADYLLSSISLVGLNILNSDTGYLPPDIDVHELKEIFTVGIEYCINFIAGMNEDALKARRVRDLQMRIDPLKLESADSHVKEEAQERNEKLKEILGKYL